MDTPTLDTGKTMRRDGRLVLIGSLASTVLLVFAGVHHPIINAMLAFFNALGMAMMFFADGAQSNPHRTSVVALIGGVVLLVGSFLSGYGATDIAVINVLISQLQPAAAALLAVAAMLGLTRRPVTENAAVTAHLGR